MTDIAALTAALDAFQAEVIHVGQFDIASIFRERRLRKSQFLEWAKDPRFSNTLAYWDSNDALFAGTSFGTPSQKIDLSSIRPYPAEPGGVVLIAEMDGQAKDLMPRHVLRRQLERADSMGYSVKGAFEYELILLDESDVSVREHGFRDLRQFAPDNKCWSGTTAATHAGLIAELEAEILGYGINLFGLGVELGPGCLEATLGAEFGLKAADDAAFLRLAVRSFARRKGMTASFMPFLGAGYPGLGGHLSLSLHNKTTGENKFSGADGQTNPLARSFIAGMMDVVPECYALCTSSVNAYRRLAPGSWAPKAVAWQDHTFTTAVRSVPSAGEHARLEFRSPPADCNSYLTMALMLGAGLDGIERDLPHQPATEATGPDDVPAGCARFPRDLYDAAERLDQSKSARRLFGDAFVTNFVMACKAEDAALRKAVSDEERRRYLEA
jgi:glutamine synthetase